MVFEGRSYSALVVSSSDKLNEGLKPMLQSAQCERLSFVSSVAAGKRALLEQPVDFVIVNSPLPDDAGIKFAMDVCADKHTVCMLFVKAEMQEAVHAKVMEHGVYTLGKPISGVVIAEALKWMAVTRERLRRLEKKTVSIEEKMEEIRLVNRAKWLLIEKLTMTEPDAHRYIEKRAMDACISKKEVAESIIKTYEYSA